MILPPCITYTFRHMAAVTPISWLTSRRAVPVSRTIRRRSCRICACTTASSAVVGSSAMIRSGSQARAMASTTR